MSERMHMLNSTYFTLIIVFVCLIFCSNKEGLIDMWLIFSAVGSILIVAGLYAVLWGKDKELKEEIEETKVMKIGNKEWNNHDLELQLHAISNGNRN